VFEKRITLFKLLGFEVRLDWTWIFIAVLIVWSLSTGLFPEDFKGLSSGHYLMMGIAGAIGLFISIIVHEFAHSVMARRYGIPMKGITLFIFGGVAEMGDEPGSAKAEFMMASVGPLSSMLIAIMLYGVYTFGSHVGLPIYINGVIQYLSWINGILAGFNLVPAFPLDGGRILRSILWGIKGDIIWATRISSNIGSGFGIFLVMMGVFSILAGNYIGGIWWTMIGLFVRKAAQMSYRQVLNKKAFIGERVSRHMVSDPVVVSPSISVNELVEEYVYKYHYRMFPVVEAGQVLGCVSINQIRVLPRLEWEVRSVKDITVSCSGENSISPDADVIQALSIMNRTRSSSILVMDRGRLEGVITLKDIMKLLHLRGELK